MNIEQRILKRGSSIFGICLVMAWMIAGCANYTVPGKGNLPIEANSCEGCHSDYDMLIAVHDPDTVTAPGGCGGGPVIILPYDRVYMGGSYYEEFKKDPHYSIGCTSCHGGIGDTGDKYKAHSEDWISSPSSFYNEKCGSCHNDITSDFATSIHNGTGQKRKVAMRSNSEYTSSTDFDKLPAHQIEAYNTKCGQCHGTCGNCHIVRPDIAGGGLATGHVFNETPDWVNVCVSCHVSRGGHAFLGEKADPDYHRSELKYTCLDCHDGMELHGDGIPVEQRYDYSELPTCEGCHDDLDPDLSNRNNYHTWHYEEFACQVCHSQDYNNCGACHIKDGHPEFEAYMDYKIALNTLPDLKDGKFSLVRRTLAHPDNWKGYGDEFVYDNFDEFPTYNYTTPHNILKFTDRTEVESGESCSSNCHIRNEGGTLVNVENFLWLDSLETFEVTATGPYTVDGQLPIKWFK